jgi:hypothetical protein
MVQALRLLIAEETTSVALLISLACEQVRLLRACTTIVILYMFFNRGGSGIAFLNEDLVTSKDDKIRMYHRTRKGPRRWLAKRKQWCYLPPSVYTKVIHMLLFFDSLR